MKKAPSLNLSRLSTPDLEVDTARQIYDRLESVINHVVPLLKTQLDLLDDVDLGSDNASDENRSFLYSLVKQIEAFDSNFIRSKLSEEGMLEECLNNAQKRGEIDYGDGVIFARRGSRKTEVKKVASPVRRISFAATTFADNHSILHQSTLLEMTDLEYLFYLNGYHVPYSKSKNHRSMYESFISILVQVATEGEPFDSEEAACFQVLQECIFMIHIITEFTVSIIECILEIIRAVNARIKTIGLTIDQKLNLPELQHPTLEHLILCFNDERKIFAQFRKQKITGSQNELDGVTPGENSLRFGNSGRDALRNSINWSSKINTYNRSLIDAVELYSINCSAFMDKVKALKADIGRKFESEEGSKSARSEYFLSQVYIYVNELQSFMTTLATRDDLYIRMVDNSLELLDTLQSLENKYPVRYGLTPRKRGSPLNRSRNSSATSSPRSDTEAETPRSGRGLYTKVIAALGY